MEEEFIMKRFWLKKKLLIGVVVLAVALLGFGITVPALAAPGNAPVNNGVYVDSPTLARLAAVLGLTPEELNTQLQTGKTLAQIAQEKNVLTATLIDAIIALYADQVALQVKYGYVTQERSRGLLDAARKHAGYLLEQNLASAQGYNNGYGGCGNWGGNMMGGNYGPGNGWGMMGNGIIGPGMMGEWGGYNNPNTTPGANPTTPGRTGFQGQSRNSGRGWGGMMGGGMMGWR
jgi:hypothetical protein